MQSVWKRFWDSKTLKNKQTHTHRYTKKEFNVLKFKFIYEKSINKNINSSCNLRIICKL